MKKKEEFESIIEMFLSTSLNYEKTKHSLIKCREVMLKHKTFEVMNANTQFDVCSTICIIAIQTSRHDLMKVKNFGFNHTEDLKYSIYDGYVEEKTATK